jgi:acyl-CoA oxidase
MQYLEALSSADEPLGLNLHEVGELALSPSPQLPADTLQSSAFQPVIAAQCSDEQQAIWLPKCMNHEVRPFARFF